MAERRYGRLGKALRMAEISVCRTNALKTYRQSIAATMKLFIFNPEHDLALANNSENYVPPKDAVDFAVANEMYPARFAPVGSLILCHGNRIVDPTGNPADDDVKQLVPVPWGWDKAVVKRLRLIGMGAEQLPSDEVIDTIRNLSHRRTAAEGMTWLKQKLIFVRTEVPTEVRTMDDLQLFLQQHGGKAMFKAPWSGRGQGILWTENGLTDKQLNRCARIIAHQGCIMAEPLYDVVQDFAMEYFCRDKKVQFLGHSLFTTRNCAYTQNEKSDDWEIVGSLAQLIPVGHIDAARKEVASFLCERIAPVYDGPVGVDMFVYDSNGRKLLNPMVEINLRFTMGMRAAAYEM